jgi:hypothetical protein
MHIVRAWLVVLTFALGSDLLAQRKIELSGKTPLPFQVEITTRVVLSDSASPVKSSNLELTAIDSRKRYYVPAKFENRFLVFDSSGRFLRSVGRQGKGPGEYRFLNTILAGGGDTILAVELGQGISVLTFEYRYVRRMTAFILDPIQLRNGGYAFVAPDKQTNWPDQIAILDKRGKLQKRFWIGPKRTEENRQFGGRSSALTEDSDGAIWAAMRGEYLIDQWSPSGNRRTIVKRAVDDPALKDLIALRFNEPNIQDLQIDSAGQLWVLFTLRNGNTHRLRVQTEHGVRDEDIDECDTVIDVIDVRRGELLASTRSPSGRLMFAAPGVVYRLTEGSDGSNVLEVLDVKLVPAK